MPPEMNSRDGEPDKRGLGGSAVWRDEALLAGTLGRVKRRCHRLALELLLDLIDEVEVQLEQLAQEAVNDQQVPLTMR
jgi:hypothetical protein